MVKNDAWDGQRKQVADPASGGAAVVPSDTEDLSDASRSLYVASDGNVVVEMVDGEELTFTGVKAGSILPVRVTKVKATGTTATGILALW